MILAVAVAEAAPISPLFAPPIGLSIPYRTVSTRPAPMGGAVRIVLDERLRFDTTANGLVVSATADQTRVDAPAAVRSMWEALFAGSEGLRTRARLGPDGQILSIVDGAQSWAEVTAFHARALARAEIDPALSATEKARMRALWAARPDLDPATRDARLADGFAALLAPAVPALRPGESRRFTSVLTSPTGPLASTGSVTLVEADARLLHFRIETRTDPAAARFAADAVLNDMAAAASTRTRADIQAEAEAIGRLTYSETLDAFVERPTGLLIRSRLVRRTTDRTGKEQVIEQADTTRLIDTVS